MAASTCVLQGCRWSSFDENLVKSAPHANAPRLLLSFLVHANVLLILAI